MRPMPVPSLPRRTVRTIPAVVLLGLVVAAPPHATPARLPAATTCDIKRDGRKLGTTYVTSLKATSVSCVKAKRVVKAFNACRRSNGGADGRCSSAVQGFRCTEHRGAAIPTQYSSRVTCRSSGRQVRFAYTQFT